MIGIWLSNLVRKSKACSLKHECINNKSFSIKIWHLCQIKRNTEVWNKEGMNELEMYLVTTKIKEVVVAEILKFGDSQKLESPN